MCPQTAFGVRSRGIFHPWICNRSVQNCYLPALTADQPMNRFQNQPMFTKCSHSSSSSSSRSIVIDLTKIVRINFYRAVLHCVSQPADLKSKVYIVKYDLICLRMFATFFDGLIWHFSWGFQNCFPFLRTSAPKVSIRYRRDQFRRIFWGPQKSQNFNFILEKNLFNKKVVFLHINLALNTQNCPKINFKWCFGPKTYF